MLWSSFTGNNSHTLDIGGLTMESKRFWGIVVIVILVAAFCTAVYITAFGYPGVAGEQERVKELTREYELLDSQLSGVNYVNLNFTSNSGGYSVSFQNKSDSLYDITIHQDKNSTPASLTYNKVGDVLYVNANMDSGSADVILGNRCTYNGTFDTKAGGISIIMANNSKVDTFSTNIKYVGGGMVLIGDTAFNQINLNANMGGFLIRGERPNIRQNGAISTGVQLGGVTIQVLPDDKTGLRINNLFDIGGVNFEPANFEIINNTTNSMDIQTKGFDNKTIKLQINNTVGLGGVNINMMMFWPHVSMFQ